ILARGATPSTPFLVPRPCPWPAISDAIQVPWAPQLGFDTGVLTPVKSGPFRTDPVRSDTDGPTPLSSTATPTTLPYVTPHAAGTSSALSTHCCRCRA